MSLPAPFHVSDRGDGKTYWVVGNTITTRAGGSDTAGAYTLFEILVPAGAGTPPHIHRNEDEAFYVVEGELAFVSDEQSATVGAGGFIHAPRGVRHCYQAKTDVRMLVLALPAGIEGYFEEVGHEVTADRPAPEAPSEDDFRRLMEAAPGYGLEIFPPA